MKTNIYNAVDGDWVAVNNETSESFVLDVLTFSAGEPHVNLPKDYDFGDIKLTARIDSTKLWMELLVIFSALDSNPTVEFVDLWLPYFPGSRQDRTDGYAPHTCDMYAQALHTSSSLRYIYTYDLHSELAFNTINLWHTGYVTNIGVDQVDLSHNFASNYKYIVAPDKGARPRAEAFRNAHFPNATMLYAEKTRDFNTGKIIGYEFVDSEVVKDGTVLVVDDICDGGRTFIELANAFNQKWGKQGFVSPLDLYVSHGIFSKTPEVLEDHYRHIYTTDSFYHPFYKADFPYVVEIPSPWEKLVQHV